MKYFNNINDSLRIYKLFKEFLSDEELGLLRNGRVTLRNSCNEAIKLNNGLLIKYYALSGSSSLNVINDDATQYLFEPLTKHLRELIKFSLLNGNKEDFIKIILSKNELMELIFGLFSDDVKSWIINKVAKISIWNLNNYQFTEINEENRVVLSLCVNGAELNVFTKNTADLGVPKAFTTRSASDLPFIASHVNNFIRDRL